MSQTKFTIIIPTRERSDTLYQAIMSCVKQEYDHLEIHINDNFSQDDTKAVVESFKDTRVKYFNSGTRLSMSHNWEFALSHVSDGYLAILGDDDAILPGVLVEVDKIVQEGGYEGVNGKLDNYYWPSCPNPLERNTLKVSFRTDHKVLDGGESLKEVYHGRMNYFDLPNLYKCFISVDAINRVKRKSGGKFFHSNQPDLY